jgi:hypothetical protein
LASLKASSSPMAGMCHDQIGMRHDDVVRRRCEHCRICRHAHLRFHKARSKSDHRTDELQSGDGIQCSLSRAVSASAVQHPPASASNHGSERGSQVT